MYKRKPDFLDDLNEHEQELVRSCAAGIDCKFGDERPEPDDETASTIRAELIRYLLLGGDDDHPVDPYGVQIYGARVTNVLNLEGCTNLPTLILINCEITETPILLDARGLTLNFTGSRLPGLMADGVKTTGDVFLRNGLEATSEVRLLGADIGGDLDCTGGTFSGESMALDLDGTNVAGTFYLRKLKAPPKGRIDLYDAKVGSINDDPESWPEKRGNLVLNGFRYDRFVESVTDYASRKEWLERQYQPHLTNEFKPQPFEQLAKVLREMGHNEEARQIMILKNQYQRKATYLQAKANIKESPPLGLASIHDGDATGIPVLGTWRLSLGRVIERVPPWLLSYSNWVASAVFGSVVGYGYRPLYAVIWAALFVAVGSHVFQAGYDARAMVPNNPFLLKSEWKDARDTVEPYKTFQKLVPDFQPFDPVVYSIDTFVPLVNLHQEPHWIPQDEGKPGAWPWIRVYLWFHIAAGWVITTLFAASLAGIVKRD